MKTTNRRIAALYIRDLPRDVKDQFKAHCARRGTSMTKRIEELMRGAIKADRKTEEAI